MEVLKESKLEHRNNNYQKSFNAEKLRRKREEGLIQLRKQKRTLHILKKRALQVEHSNTTQDALNPLNEFLNFDLTWIPANLSVVFPEILDESISNAGRLNLLISYISTVEDLNTLFYAIQTLRKILSNDSMPPLHFIMTSGISKKLIKLLACDSKDLKVECLWCILNLATGPSHVVKELVEQGLIPLLAPLLMANENDLVELCVWCIGNLAGDSIYNRDQLVQLTPRLTTLIGTFNQENKKNIVWTLSNLCRGKPLPDKSITDQILKVVPGLLHCQDESILSDCCWALSYISDGDNQRIQDILDLNIIPDLINLLSNESSNVTIPCLRTLGSIVAGTESQTQIVLNLGLVDRIPSYLSSKKVCLKREALWTLSNITAGTDEQINLVLSHPCIHQVIECLKDPDFEIKKEALWVVSNATHAKSSNIVLKVITLGAFGSLCDMLDQRESKILMVALEAINNLLTAGGSSFEQEGEGKTNEVALKFDEIGGLSKMEDLQDHPNPKIYKRVLEIMEQHYGLEEVNDENETPVPGEFVFH